MKTYGIVLGVIILILTSIIVFPRMPQVQDTSHRVRVVTTLFPLYDFTKRVGGDKVEVTLLLPPGVEAHTFEPKPSDIIKIHESDLFLYTGKFMEPWAEELGDSITENSVSLVDMSSGIQLIRGEEEQDSGKTGVDPHYWLDFNNAKIIIQTIAEALSEEDPAHARYFQENGRRYQDQLTNLDTEYKTQLTRCATRKIVYGGHYGFGYMARRYNLQYTAAQGFVPDSEPTAQDLIKLVDQVRKQDIRYVFYEELTSPKIAKTLADETDSKLLLLNAAHNVSKTDFEKGISFISIMENNLNNLQIGLGCLKNTHE